MTHILMFLLLFQVNSDFSFTDNCNNKIILENLNTFPKEIDSTFLKNNLTSNLLNEEYCKATFNFEIRVIEIKKLSKNKYDLRVYAIPQGDSISMKEKFRYMGYSHYLMQTRKIDNKLVFESINWSFEEI